MTTFLHDLKLPPCPERDAFVRGFVQALMIAETLGMVGAGDVLWRTAITHDDIRQSGLDAVDVRHALSLARHPEATP